MDQVLPVPISGVDALEVYLRDERPAYEHRPWVVVNMISSIDGASAIEGSSRGLASEGDRAVLRALRACCDWIVVGSRTANLERYRLPSPNKAALKFRLARGQTPAPRLAIVTASGNIDPTLPAFATKGSKFLEDSASPDSNNQLKPMVGLDQVESSGAKERESSGVRSSWSKKPMVRGMQEEALSSGEKGVWREYLSQEGRRPALIICGQEAEVGPFIGPDTDAAYAKLPPALNPQTRSTYIGTEGEVRISQETRGGWGDRSNSGPRVEVVRLDVPVPTPDAVIDELHKRGAKIVLCEGGPTWNAQLAEANLIDEFCLTISPTIAMGNSSRIIAETSNEALSKMHLVRMLTEENYLFARYTRTP